MHKYAVLLNYKVMKILFIYTGVSIREIMLELIFGKEWYNRLKKDYQHRKASIYIYGGEINFD